MFEHVHTSPPGVGEALQGVAGGEGEGAGQVVVATAPGEGMVGKGTLQVFLLLSSQLVWAQHRSVAE